VRQFKNNSIRIVATNVGKDNQKVWTESMVVDGEMREPPITRVLEAPEQKTLNEIWQHGVVVAKEVSGL